MSRILFLTPQLPYPPHQGAAIRNLNLIKLAAERHEVAVHSFVRSPEEEREAGVLREWVAEVRTLPAPRRGYAVRAFQTLFSPLPDMGHRLASKQFAELPCEADIVQAEAIEMAGYMPGEARTVLDCHNAEWSLQQRTCEVDLREGKLIGAAYSALQRLKLRRYERESCRRAGAIVAVSEEDRRALLDLDPAFQVDIIPNGVDCRTFAPAGELTGAETVLFTGTLDFRPNIDAVRWFVSKIWPRVQSRLPRAQLLLAGRAPVGWIRDLDGRAGIRVVANPPDIVPYFRDAAVYVVPVRSGGGSRYKLLQAMAMALGIVSTTMGMEGVEARAGEQLRVANEPLEFAEAVVELLRDPPLRSRMGAAARDVALARYDWPLLGPSLWALYDRLLKSDRMVQPAV